MATPQLNFWQPVSWEWITNVQELKPQMKWRWATNLFSDEQEKYNQMTADWLDDTTARALISKKRKTLLKDISTDEAKVLIKMQQDWLDTQTAVDVLKENRYKNLPLWKKALKIPFDASVWASSLATEQVWSALDFATGWQMPYFKKQVEWVKEVTWRSFEDSTAFKTGRWILWAWEMAAVWPTKVAPTMLWRAAQWAATMWVIWAAEPILEKWADVTPWEIVWGWVKWAVIWGLATPILEKAVLPVISKTLEKTFKYWKAWIKGWVKWASKSIARDVKAPFKKIKLEWLAPAKAASLSTKANRFNARDIEKFKQITWETPWEFATKRGMTKVWDEAVDETTRLWKASMDEADDALKLIDWKFKIKKWPDYLWEMLNDLWSRLKKTIWPWGRKINLLNKKYTTQWLSMSEINEIKRLYWRNFKYSWVEAWSENALRSKNLQDWVRKWQFKTAWEEWFTNLKQINKTTQGWKNFADSLAKKLKRSSWNNNISLTDWVALSWWEPTNVALFLGKKVWELTPVKRWLIKGLWKQTKPSIIKANRESILKANLKKENVNIDNILSDRTVTGDNLLLKKPKVINEPIKKTVTESKSIIKDVKKKAISNKKAFISPKKIWESIKLDNNSKTLTVYKWRKWLWTDKKFPLDYFAETESVAKSYWPNVTKKTIKVENLADFTKSNTKLKKILEENYWYTTDNITWKLRKVFDDKEIKRLVNKALNETSDKLPWWTTLYEIIEDPLVTKALKKAWFDAVRFKDFWWAKFNFKAHNTIAILNK